MAPILEVQLLLCTIVVILSTNVLMADPAKDREDCAEQLVEMATCLPYVEGRARAPTPDCCKGLKKVLNDNKKCLCVIVRDRDDPDLSLKINVTLALTLPSVCDAPANVSKCPELLKMDPNSAEAQVFYQLERNSTQTATTSPSPSPIAGGPTSGKNLSNASGKKGLGLKAVIGSILVLFIGYIMDLKWFCLGK